MEATPQQLDALFPHPGTLDIPNTSAKRVPGPVRQAGWTDESTQAVRELLKDNHRRWHIFFNDKQFHNHAPHHLLAIYAMGADGELLKAAYETHVAYQKPAFPPPEDKKISTIIDDSNWKDHLGDERYYQAYLAFWTTKLVDQSTSITSVLEQYVFSKDANVVPGKNSKDAPMMLSRFLGGFLHPLIHSGYGVEFSLPGLVAEGIAEATGQRTESAAAFPATLFDPPTPTPKPAPPLTLTSHLASLFISSTATPKPTTSTSTSNTQSNHTPHALTILSQISQDPAFSATEIGLPVPADADEDEDEDNVGRVIRVVGDKLLQYTAQWSESSLETLTSTSTGETQTLTKTGREVLAEKFEEVVWMNTVIYAVGGWAGRKRGEDEREAFNGDFFLMHLVTSALFLPSFLTTLSPPSASLLLKTYFTVSLVLYVARGRPALPVAAFYAGTTPCPQPPQPPSSSSSSSQTHSAPSSQSQSHSPPSSSQAQADSQTQTQTHPAKETLTPHRTTPNPWLPLIQTTLVHPDEHLCKLQRALWHFADVYGGKGRGRGWFSGGAQVGVDVEGGVRGGDAQGQSGGVGGKDNEVGKEEVGKEEVGSGKEEVGSGKESGWEDLDGTLFVRAAGLTADRLGWMREGQERRGWDRVGFF